MSTISFIIDKMAKGKHPLAAGAVRPDKILHPKSRKVKKVQRMEIHK